MAAEKFTGTQLMDRISCFDCTENYCRGFMAGLLSGTDKYRESGNSRPIQC